VILSSITKLWAPRVDRPDSCASAYAGSELVGVGRLPTGLARILVLEAVLRQWCVRRLVWMAMEVRFGCHFVVRYVWRLGRRAESKEFGLYANLFFDFDGIECLLHD
jgi:hypothetical protein